LFEVDGVRIGDGIVGDGRHRMVLAMMFERFIINKATQLDYVALGCFVIGRE
jgi:hypothetical protein